MATQIYLGYPPENIKKWIMENVVIEPTNKYKEATQFIYNDGTIEEYDTNIIDGELLKNAGLFDEYDEKTTKWYNLDSIIFGTKVQTISEVWTNATKYYIPGDINILTMTLANCGISELVIEEGITVLNAADGEGLGSSIFRSSMVECDIILPSSLTQLNGNIRDQYSAPFQNKLIFKGKTIEQVKQMAYYPFGIDESQIEVL